VVNRITSTNSVESWDFPTTINSPLASIHRRRFSEDLFPSDYKENMNIFPLTKESSESDVPPLSSSLTSNSSIVLNSTTIQSTASLHHTSPPSSYTESTAPAYGVQEKVSSESRPDSEPLVSIVENTSQHTPVSLELSLPAPSESPRTPSRQSVPPSTSPITSSSQPGLWRKIKINVRPSSRSDDEGLDKSPRKVRGKISGIFASASKGLLSS
jgi:serine/threonine-protein kinase OSR1/STK39